MADRPKLSTRRDAPPRDPYRRPVRGGPYKPPPEAAAPAAAKRPPRPSAPRPQDGDPRTPPAADARRDTRPEARRDPRRDPRSDTRPAPHPDPRRAAPPAAAGRPPRPTAGHTAAPANERPPARPARPAPKAEAGQGVRISKLITERGLASRREADDWIAAGWVKVDGRMAVLGQRVDPAQQLEIDPRARAEQVRQVTILLHKPIGYVSGQAEDGYEPAVVLVQPANHWSGDSDTTAFHPGQLRGLAPAGRLDIDSTGLLVLTQDGRVAKLLIGDESRVEKEYLVRVTYNRPGRLPDADLEKLRHGLELDGKPLRPARVSWQNEDQLRFVLREGRKRQIRRMCEAVGLQVVGLKRVRIGSISLGPLPVGQWRYLGEHERFI